jgi:type I restriction enzyme M protein
MRKKKTSDRTRGHPRRSLFDSLPDHSEENLYCRLDSLSNEASVEKFFVDRMLDDLDYRDSQVQTKKSIAELTVSLGGSKTEKYKPDYVLTFRRKPKWVLDAKATTEKIEKWVPQCGGYCLGLNQTFENENPVQLFVLTNGLRTNVYHWDNKKPILELSFSDFEVGNPKYEKLRGLLAAKNLLAPKPIDSSTFNFERPTPQLMKTLFAACHRAIWKSEGSNPTAAFMEFTKLMFVKLWCDRQLREDPVTKALLEQGEKIKLPKSAVTFSNHWIDSEKVTANPVNDILFKTLRETIEKDIADRKKKRIFQRDENIDLRPDTIRTVVTKLQHYDMFGIDEDLNGRLFEAFLNATMRGKELGQYFTPRSIVKLITRLAHLKVTRQHVDKCLDACCGTGGFLIEALTEMRNSVRRNESLSHDAKEKLIDQISNESLYGIDFGKAPPVARIARINMYLHGDGGSRIYYADALDKALVTVPGQEVELTRDQEELSKAIDGGLRFQCVLTNPPFSMTKELKNETEARILKQYDLAQVQGTSRFRNSLRSNAMFMERYRDLLVDGGRLLTVIDDGLLAGEDFAHVRNFIRKEFLIRAVISLPGDAFQRSGARAKTTVLYLEKRKPKETGQPDAFVFECRYVGLDDVVLRTRPSVADQARKRAEDEIEEVLAAFDDYMSGKKGPWLVAADRLGDRLDAKSLRPWHASELESKWKKAGATSEVLSKLVDPVWERVTLKPDKNYSFLRITYEGSAERGETSLGREVGYTDVSTAKAGDIVVSNISAVYRAICVLPKSAEDLLISKEFTVLRPKKGVDVDANYLWAILRSAAVVAEWLSGATGVGRHRVGWDLLSRQKIPMLSAKARMAIGNFYRQAQEHEENIRQLRASAVAALAPLELEGETAVDRLAGAKPPK